MADKKTRVRAIIFVDDKIVSMYREREGRIFYTFPGGGLEGDESQKECVKREMMEEFGIVIEPIKKVYVYENKNGIEHFYICKWVSGDFGTGNGEEFDPTGNNGIYRPELIEIKKIPSLPLMPPEVATAFYNDYVKNGERLRDRVATFKVD